MHLKKNKSSNPTLQPLRFETSSHTGPAKNFSIALFSGGASTGGGLGTPVGTRPQATSAHAQVIQDDRMTQKESNKKSSENIVCGKKNAQNMSQKSGAFVKSRWYIRQMLCRPSNVLNA